MVTPNFWFVGRGTALCYVSGAMPVLPRFTSARPLARALVDQYITVHLPGEVMQCLVIEVIDANRAIIEIDGQPMAKTHQYRKGDRTGARRRRQYGMDIWEAIDDRDFIANRSPTEFRAPEPEKAPTTPRKRKAKR